MSFGRLIMLLVSAMLMAPPIHAQAMENTDDVTSSGYYRDQDTLPGAVRFYRQLPGGEDSWWGIGPSRPKIRRASFFRDAHIDVEDFSPQQRCQKCHIPQTKDLHGLRMNITCVQCHRSQPVAGVYQYYSPLNPIRRHAYVCAKCHEGASPSFATYMVHEPNPISAEARHAFPLLYYSVWFMLILAGGVFLFFLPYTALWWLRDLIEKIKGNSNHG